MSWSYSHTLYNYLYSIQARDSDYPFHCLGLGGIKHWTWLCVLSWKDRCVIEWMRSRNSLNLFSSHTWLFQELTQTFIVYRGERHFSISHYQNFVFRFQLFRSVSPGIEEAGQDWSQPWDYLSLFPGQWLCTVMQFLFSEESHIMTICGAQPGWPSTVMQNLRSDHGYRKQLSIKSLGTCLHMCVCMCVCMCWHWPFRGRTPFYPDLQTQNRGITRQVRLNLRDGM